MPHCWPQKQQCVSTILSGTTPGSSRIPVGLERCGPKCCVMSCGEAAKVAMMGLPSLGVEIPVIFFAQGAFAQAGIRIHGHRHRSRRPGGRPTGPQDALAEFQPGTLVTGTNPYVMRDY